MNRWTTDKTVKWVRGVLLFGLLACLSFSIEAIAKAPGHTATAKSKKFTLVIDAGHGGHDAGAVGPLTKEKYINLNVALAFGRLVEQNCPDVRVIYTRKTDVFVPLHTRADIANRNKADLFISIHTNALPKGRISRGMETYTLGMHRAADNLEVAKRENEAILYESDYKERYEGFDPRSSESYIMFEFMQDHNMAHSVELAKFVQRRTCASANRINKGVKQAGFLVLRETSMPSCLIELGFISTPDEERFLHSTSGVNQLAQGIYQAFLDYCRKFDSRISVPYKAEAQQEVSIPAVVPQQQVEQPAKESKRERRRREKAEQEAREAAEKAAEKAAQDAAKAEQDVKAAQAAQEAAAKAEQEAAAKAAQAEEEARKAREAAEKAGNPQQKVQQNPQPTPQTNPQPMVQNDAPVFKVQIFATSSKLPKSSPRFQGQQDVDFYQDGGLYKYTVGSSTDYREINALRKELLAKFPQAFLVAFKGGQRMDIHQAIREFNSKK